MSAFQSQLADLARDATARPETFGEGVRLLFSCRTRNMMTSLVEAETDGLEARGVGRMHILIEIGDVVPDEQWLGDKGWRISHYFDRIGGIDPQIAIDRGATE